MINLILSETDRSLLYLTEIIKNKIRISKIFLYSRNYGRTYRFIKKNKIKCPLILFKTNDVNSINLGRKSKFFRSDINIISTYPGEIINKPSLIKKKLLHCHSGDLPKFKGSTTIYYTIIQKQKICVSIIEINKNIDTGKIIYKKYFPYPKNFREIEKNFDNKIRALALVDYLKINKKYKHQITKKNYLPYYIAHPMIRQIVLNKNYFK